MTRALRLRAIALGFGKDAHASLQGTNMLYQELIRLKRDGQALSRDQIGAIVTGLHDGTMGDAQIGAFAMAVLLRGMTLDERVALTLAMRDSGQVMTWDDGPVVDKHSTGGVGDTVSLMLAPALAACGAKVPMISGRGLGHTGGTLDKLEAIAGYDTSPAPSRLRKVVKEVGCAIIGQTHELAPADRRLYAIRDISATVESLDLIVASILSKKLAAGLEALVLDVKCGAGAFMTDISAARSLAQGLVSVAQGAGCRISALITSMDAPLGPAAGNALEVQLALDFLRGTARPFALWEVTCALGAEALQLAGLASDMAQARKKIENAFNSGAAAECFARMIAALDGPKDVFACALPLAPVMREITAPNDGVVAQYETRAIGLAVIDLGGGRRQPEDRVDPCVGFSAIAPVGTVVMRGDPLALVHAADERGAAHAEAAFLQATTLQKGGAVGQGAPVLARITR